MAEWLGAGLEIGISRVQVPPNSSAALVHSQLVCLLPVGILNMLSLFELFISLALKSPNGERSIKYTYKGSSFCEVIYEMFRNVRNCDDHSSLEFIILLKNIENEQTKRELNL